MEMHSKDEIESSRSHREEFIAGSLVLSGCDQ